MPLDCPSVSVVIPTRNRREWLKSCVASVLTQKGVPWELIVVDDASSDGTAEWLAGLNHPRLKVLRQETRGERSRARNRGLAAARGEFVLFLDDDDQLWPDTLRRLAVGLRREVAAVAVIGARQAWFTLERFKRREPHPRRFLTRNIGDDLLVGWCPTAGQALIRSELVRQVGGFDPSLPVCEDRDLWHKLSRLGPVAFDPGTAVTYRQHPFQSWTPNRMALREKVARRAIRALPRGQRRRGLLLRRTRTLLDGAEADFMAGRTLSGARKAARAVALTPRIFLSPLVGEWVLRWLAGRAARYYLPPRERASAASTPQSSDSGRSVALAFHPEAPVVPPGLQLHPIVVQRRGGLGNQLFQHAVAVQLGREGGAEVFHVRTDSPLRLEDIQLEDMVGPLREARGGDLLRFLLPPARTPWWLSRLYRRVRATLPLLRIVWQDPGERVERLERPWIGSGLLVNGYFQSLDWVEGGLPEVCGQLLERRPEGADPRADVIALSFRTGVDFERAGWSLPWSYYTAALERLDPRREATLWLIGDRPADLAGFADRLRAAGWQVDDPGSPSGKKAVDDFWNLARAGKVVLSCSTFAWWAAVAGDALWGEDRHEVICADPWRPAIRRRLRRAHWKALAAETDVLA